MLNSAMIHAGDGSSEASRLVDGLPATKMPPPLNPPVRTSRKMVKAYLGIPSVDWRERCAAEVGPVQSVQDAVARVVQNAPAPIVQNAPAQIADDTRASQAKAKAPIRPRPPHRTQILVSLTHVPLSYRYRCAVIRLPRIAPVPSNPQRAEATPLYLRRRLPSSR